jgi:hypothetical protein
MLGPMGTVLCRSDTIKRVAKYLHALHTIFTAVPVQFIVPLVNDSFHFRVIWYQ